MRGRKKAYKRPEYANEIQTSSILKYIRPEIEQEFRSKYQPTSDEDLLDLVFREYAPNYLSYNYILESADEFDLENPLCKRFMLEYLVSKCESCDSSLCLNSHPNQNTRRKPQRLFNGLWTYLPKLCGQSNCNSYCEFAHNIEEIEYHPLVYKTKVCKHPTIKGTCKQNGKFCPNAHGDLRKPALEHLQITLPEKVEEQKVVETVFTLETFKINPCKIASYHDKRLCVFFHDQKDRRRDPDKYVYGPARCQRGFNADLKCYHKDNCRFSHNEIEELYHKDVYLTKPCQKKACKLGETCPFSHNVKPEPSENIEQSMKNYIVANKALQEELDTIHETKKELEQFMCIFCSTEVADFIFNCGHLSCSKCVQGDSCVIDFGPIHPVIEIKFE